MTDNETGCAKMLLAGTFVGAAALTTCSYAAGLASGYVKWGRELNEIKEAQEIQQESLCNRVLEPIWLDFVDGCSQKTSYTINDGSLDPVLERRNSIRNANNCPDSIKKKVWNCAYNASQRNFEASRE